MKEKTENIKPVIPAKELSPVEDLERFLEEKRYIINVIPNFTTGDDGRLLYKAGIEIKKI